MDKKELFEKQPAVSNSTPDKKSAASEDDSIFESISSVKNFINEPEDDSIDAFLKRSAAAAQLKADPDSNPSESPSEPVSAQPEASSGSEKDPLNTHDALKTTDVFSADADWEKTPLEDACTFEDDRPTSDKADDFSDRIFPEENPSETSNDASAKSKASKPASSQRNIKKPLVIAGSILAVLLLIYLGAAFYFKSHYLIGTTMNGISVSGKTAAEVETLLQSRAASHTLTLKERNDQTETLDADQIHMQYVSDGTVETLLQQQNAFAWPMALFPQNKPSLEATFSYDEAKLDEALNALQAVSGPNVVKAENAHPVFKDGTFVIQEEVSGSELDPEIFKTQVKDAILSGKESLDLEAAGCYKAPVFHKDSPEVSAAAEQMNRYIKAVVTYSFGDQQEVLDSNTIASWLGTDSNMQVTFNQDLMKQYLNGLSEKYDTYGKARTFTTTGGAVLTIDGGDYGWLIDIDGETAELMNIIQAGNPVSREPVYAQTAVNHTAGQDYGNTYVEISLGSQTMWFYKNGSLVVSTPIVTGSISGGYGTPGGVYDLDYKAADVTLKGPGYASPVSFWMPYAGDIGIHDASWRSQFGGDIYLNGGSHGCVNTPYAAVSQIFYGIEAGDPVIVY